MSRSLRSKRFETSYFAQTLERGLLSTFSTNSGGKVANCRVGKRQQGFLVVKYKQVLLEYFT